MDDKIAALEQRLKDWSATLQPLCQASSLGAEDMVLTDVICRLALPIPVFTLDTGRLHEATYRLLDRIYDHYGCRITVVWPNPDAVQRLVHEQGMNGFYDSVERRRRCCQVRKVEGLERALSGQRAWMTGLRREQSPERGEVALEATDARTGTLKLSPLADWSRDDVWAYLDRFSVPYNPLHDQGYVSIGCEPCTRALQPGEEERAGRWWWETSGQKECGLHGADHAVGNEEEKVES